MGLQKPRKAKRRVRAAQVNLLRALRPWGKMEDLACART